MDAIQNLISYIKGFFNWILEFFTVTIVDMVKDGIEWFVVKLTVFYIDMKIQMLQFAWGIASGILDTFNLSSVISSYASQLDSSLAYVANAIGIFDAFNMVIQAGISSFILKFMRF